MTKRPKIKRLDLPCHLFFHGVDLPKYDAATDQNMEVLTDVPVFQMQRSGRKWTGQTEEVPAEIDRKLLKEMIWF